MDLSAQPQDAPTALGKAGGMPGGDDVSPNKRGKADFDTPAGKSDGELELWLLLRTSSVPLFQLCFPAGWAWDSHVISDCHPGFKLFYPKKHKF